ncbi:hypothetical protein B0O99DRAFT_656545 [Bisporella sp. PMI_857]|nr:hypothetical protein B0O99DRAFT_656545 [Bisporella sp. PMI_857]
MDEFTQSRNDDDLFSDDFEPATTPTVIEQTSSLETNPPPPVDNSYSGRQAPPGRGGGRGRGRGSRGGHRGIDSRGPAAPRSNGLASSKYATENDSPSTAGSNTAKDDSTPAQAASLDPTASSFAPPQQSLQAHRVTAVRGDRSATGGPAVKKLTEAELSEKMAKMAILNAQKAERFRLSEADSAAFAQKERELQKKRAEELKNARAMDMERAKNRERKLKAQGGREWDSEKTEADLVDRRGRSSEYVRGGHGGVIRGGLGGSRFAGGEEGDVGRNREAFEGRGRGRGGRGRGGGRGGKPVENVTVPKPEDFPALPKPAGGEWADEMATPVEEKKMDV